MTRESLAKDILTTMLPMFWTGSTMKDMTDEEGFAFLADMAVRQADALLEALATKEAPASWLSKEMQTAVKPGCLPVLKAEGTWEPITTAPDDVELRCRNAFGYSFDAIHGHDGWYTRRGDIAPPLEWYKEEPK